MANISRPRAPSSSAGAGIGIGVGVGPISQIHPISTDEEHWKQAFLSKPSISIRRGIADEYRPPYEDTSTLVLTAPSGKFVDVRLPREFRPDRPTQNPSLLPNAPSFWAFTGTSTTTFYTPDNNNNDDDSAAVSFPYTAHTVFQHDIDSKGPGVTDEGDCFLLPNGDVMEVGVWPDTRRLYKEFWTGPDPAPGQAFVRKTPVVVAEMVATADAENARGLIVRVGDYVQGVVSTRGGFRVQRLTRGPVLLLPAAARAETERAGNASADGDEDVFVHGSEVWRLDPRCNDVLQYAVLPGVCLIRYELQLGTVFRFGEYEWRVTEYVG